MARRNVRSSVSIPPELRAEMQAIEDPPNWSEIACRAFRNAIDSRERLDSRNGHSGRYARTTITIPPDLKARMDAADGVNWSAVASRAFEQILGEQSEEKTMKDSADLTDRLEALATSLWGDDLRVDALLVQEASAEIKKLRAQIANVGSRDQVEMQRMVVASLRGQLSMAELELDRSMGLALERLNRVSEQLDRSMGLALERLNRVSEQESLS